MIQKQQLGVGMFEVLVALFILAIGVLGFSALQLRAVDATIEANEKTVAMSLARDLAERIRINRLALENYRTAINTRVTNNTCFPTNPAVSYAPTCTPALMAQYDAREILALATNQNQQIVMRNCDGSERVCIYVAWGNTNITSDNVTQCMVSGSYRPDAKCVVMEAFPRD